MVNFTVPSAEQGLDVSHELLQDPLGTVAMNWLTAFPGTGSQRQDMDDNDSCYLRTKSIHTLLVAPHNH